MPDGVRRVGVRALPWLLALGLAAVVLLQTGTPVPDIGRYVTYWCLGVILPGLLVARATVGTRGNWPEDIAIGAVAGLALEVACLALWSVLGLQQQLWLWPVLVALVFIVVPGLRRHWRISEPAPLPLLWSWGVASAIGVSALIMRQSAFRAPLPPADGVYYQDTTWHLSIVHELTRSFPPQIPQVAGEVLRYHWFSHVHLAAASLESGVSATTIVLRLWILPLLAATALIGARLAMELSGRWWSGPVAAWTLIVLAGTYLLPAQGAAGLVFPDSPSQVYVVPLFLGVATLVAAALRGVRLRAGWAILALMMVAAAGSKPTVLPLVLSGTCLGGLALLLQRRREWRAALSVVAIVAVILPASMLYVAGSDGGSARISFFDFVEWGPLYRRLTGQGFHVQTGPLLPEGLADLSPRSLVVLALLLLVPLVANVGHLAPFAMIASRRLRKDPAAWFMAGTVLAGAAVYLTLSHPAYSQLYFLDLANVAAAVFGAWALAAAAPSQGRDGRAGRRVAVVLFAGTVIGAGVVVLARALTPSLSGRPNGIAPVVASFLAPLAVVLAAIVAFSVAWRFARRQDPSLRGWGLCLVLAALVLGGPAQNAVGGLAGDLVSVATNKPVHRSDGFALAPGAGAALAWVDQHTPADAVVATNRHCVTGPQRPRCPALAFWVSGLGGRRTVVEGWGYTNNMGLVAPTTLLGRLAVNDAVFTDPGVATVARLRSEYGASWLVADRSAGPVSGKLGQYAVSRFTSGQVTVYELR